jgi:hypothetical protein
MGATPDTFSKGMPVLSPKASRKDELTRRDKVIGRAVFGNIRGSTLPIILAKKRVSGRVDKPRRSTTNRCVSVVPPREQPITKTRKGRVWESFWGSPKVVSKLDTRLSSQ